MKVENNKNWNNLCPLLFELLSITTFLSYHISKKNMYLFSFQSHQFDGKVPHWYHTKCFFLRARPQAVGDISHFDSLRWEGKFNRIFSMKFGHSWNYFLSTDQEELRKMLENCLKGGVPAAVKGKKVYLVVEQSWNLLCNFVMSFGEF